MTTLAMSKVTVAGGQESIIGRLIPHTDRLTRRRLALKGALR